jgi:phosphate transport system substrate-binding protein
LLAKTCRETGATEIQPWEYQMKQFLLITLVAFSGLLSSVDSHAELQSLSKSGNLVWAGCGITKKAFMAELAKAYEKKTGVHIELHGGGATKGIRDVNKGIIDIGGACRASMEFNREERYVKQWPVAWDAIVFVVHKDNPMDNITMDQVRAIYNGDITNWAQLGGMDKPIDLYVRKSPISGVGQTLRELVFHDTEKAFTPRAHVVKSSGPAEKAVEKMITAITATGVSSATRRDVKILNVEGRDPSYDNIKEGRYMLYRPLYLVTKLRVKNPLVADFIEFATSEEGMGVIRKSGTVPYKDALKLLSKQFQQFDKAIASGL